MNQLTEAQRKALEKMPRYHILAKVSTGAVVIVFERAVHEWWVIDVDGVVYTFSRYMARLYQLIFVAKN